MALQPGRFSLDEEISFTGKPMRVAGLVQFEGADAKISTRYLLSEPAGAPLILEENGDRFSLLRPFLATAQPQVTGRALTVLGAKYALSGVRRLKVLGVAGQPPGGAPKAELLLSGQFEGATGTLMREMIPGASAQTFYSLKPVHADEVLSSAQRAAQLEAGRLAAVAKADAADDGDAAPGRSVFVKAAVWISIIIVVAGLGFACSGPDDGGNSIAVRERFEPSYTSR